MPLRRIARTAVPILLLLALLPTGLRAESARLTVLETTDLHGALDAHDYVADKPATAGLSRLATMVRALRAKGEPVLLIDAGDAIQGGPVETAWWQGDRKTPEPMMAAMSRLGYDAMAVGNHDFGHGLEGVAAARKAAGFPWLAANVTGADGRPAFDASVVKVVGGVRVGIVGLTTPAIPALEDSAHWAGLRFGPMLEVANVEIQRLRGAGQCDVIVVVAHTGLEQDPATGVELPGGLPDENQGAKLARGLVGADVLLLGHTHREWASTARDVAIVQASSGGRVLGRALLELSRDAATQPWKVVSRRASLVAADSLPPDPEIEALAVPYHQAAEAMLAERVGEAAADVGSPRGRLATGPAWELVQGAMLRATCADVALAPLYDPAAVIRRGPVTMRDVMRLLPFENGIVVVELTGAELKATLERGATAYEPYRFDAIEPGPPLKRGAGPDLEAALGVTYEVDLTRAPGDRVVDLAWKNQPVAPAQRLRVAVSSYRAGGTGGFEEIARAPRVLAHGPDLRQALVEHLRALGPLDGRASGGWTVLPDVTPLPERKLVDRLVRRGVLPAAEALRLYPDDPARRTDLAYALARAFGWREKRLSGAFADAPDSLEPWLDGLLKRGVLGPEATQQVIRPFSTVPLATALDWCEAAARAAGYALDDPSQRASFRRSLTTGTSLAGVARRDTLTRPQVLALVANTRFPVIRVLETTDFHGALLPTATDRRSKRPIGGSAVLAAWIRNLRAQNPEGTIVVDGGDAFQGTMISNLQYGHPVVEMMNLLGYDAFAIGNHDFDWSADTLQRRVAEMRFGAFGANIVERASGRRPRWVRSDTLLVRRGVRVALFGLAYPETPRVTLVTNVAHLRFDDDSTAAARLVPALRKRLRPQVVIEIGHTPAETDSGRRAHGDLARLARVPGVDLWMGGHSHNYVLDATGDGTEMIPGSQGQAIGLCDLVVDPVAGRVVERHAELVTTFADMVKPDSQIAARVTEWNRTVSVLAATPIGQNAQTLTRGRGGESTLGDLVADAMRWASKADVALTNSGGLRADLPGGTITKGTVYDVIPFDNTLVVVKLAGAEVRQMLEDGLAHGRISQQSGLRYRFDLSRPAGQRLLAVTLADGSPLDDARTYTVAVNNFMASGGDNYDTLARAKDKEDTAALVRETLERYLEERTKSAPLDVRPDGRIERVGGGE
jgi:2',3'-cyclic-nucleotide 2'-phosphodiesterase / 3'-nucleotidase / 5'-nucleotidase